MDIPPERARPRNPHLPAACHAVLRTGGMRMASAADAGIGRTSDDN